MDKENDMKNKNLGYFKTIVWNGETITKPIEKLKNRDFNKDFEIIDFKKEDGSFAGYFSTNKKNK